MFVVHIKFEELSKSHFFDVLKYLRMVSLTLITVTVKVVQRSKFIVWTTSYFRMNQEL
jgi:hypothetical protein